VFVTYTEMYLQAAKVFTYTALSFVVAMWWAPYLIDFLKWLKFWKKSSRNISMTGEKLSVTKEFYDQDEAKVQVPRAGGLLIWITALGFALLFWFVLKIAPEGNKTAQFLNFIDRRETFIPIGTLFFASIFGFIDDALATLESGGNYKAGGLKLSYRLGLVTLLSLLIGLWFHLRLDINTMSVGFWEINFSQFTLPFTLFGYIINGSWLIVPITIVIMLALYGSSMIDGFDGMSSGVLIPIYLCFAGIAFTRGYYDIATFLMVIVGAMAAYLWFNIPPAKFYMGDTGIMGLLLTLGVVAIFMDVVYILPIAGIMLVLTEGSVVLQVASKKLFKRKIFHAAPLHHHLEHIGWLRHQVTMRYWLISIMGSVVGLALGLLFR
jgi:phospho-N-acetylmuramoyl-pentapeptide-transferase